MKYLTILLTLLISTICFATTNIIPITSDTGFNYPFFIPSITTTLNSQKTPLMIDLGYSMSKADIVLKQFAAK